jgi:hypothetical protein
LGFILASLVLSLQEPINVVKHGAARTLTRNVSRFPTNQIARYQKILILNVRCIRSWHLNLSLWPRP